jgi:hypothetical protein
MTIWFPLCPPDEPRRSIAFDWRTTAVGAKLPLGGNFVPLLGPKRTYKRHARRQGGPIIRFPREAKKPIPDSEDNCPLGQFPDTVCAATLALSRARHPASWRASSCLADVSALVAAANSSCERD